MTPSDPPVPPANAPAPGLPARVRRAAERAARWQAHTLADLSWSDADRMPDAVRAAAVRLLDEQVAAIVRRLSDALPIAPDAGARTAALLREAGGPERDALAAALSHARREWLGERLMFATRAIGAPDPLIGVGESDSSVAALARELATANGEGASLCLPAQTAHDLAWTVAAALRVIVASDRDLHLHDDEALREGVDDWLRAHDEGAGSGSLARRLARAVSPRQVGASDALLSAQVALFAELVADRTGGEAERVEERLFAPDPLPIAVAMRAAGEGAAAIGGALAVVAQSLGRRIDGVVQAVDALHGLTADGARDLMSEAGA